MNYSTWPLETVQIQPLMAVQFQPPASGPHGTGAARKILEFPIRSFVPESNLFQYSPHPDGKRFLVNVNAVEPKPEIGVITNWQRLASGSGK